MVVAAAAASSVPVRVLWEVKAAAAAVVGQEEGALERAGGAAGALAWPRRLVAGRGLPLLPVPLPLPLLPLALLLRLLLLLHPLFRAVSAAAPGESRPEVDCRVLTTSSSSSTSLQGTKITLSRRSTSSSNSTNSCSSRESRGERARTGDAGGGRT